jgi:hypothetical protein
MATTTKTKPCDKCGTEYPIAFEYFSSNVSADDGFHSTCRFCVKERAAASTTRHCPECGERKSLIAFAKTPHGNDEHGRMKNCRDCWSGKISKSRRKTRTRRRSTPQPPEKHGIPTKQCAQCSTVKPRTLFAKGTGTDGLQACCRDCHKINVTKGGSMSHKGKSKPKKRKRVTRAKRRTKSRERPEGAPERKVCTACNREKTWRSFWTDRKNDDNLGLRCIDCCHKGRKGKRRPVKPHTRTVNGKTVLVGGVIPAKKDRPAQAVVVSDPLGVAATTIDALLADREQEIRDDERQKVLAEIERRYILVVKPK